jgi:hypothetical protein
MSGDAFFDRKFVHPDDAHVRDRTLVQLLTRTPLA